MESAFRQYLKGFLYPFQSRRRQQSWSRPGGDQGLLNAGGSAHGFAEEHHDGIPNARRRRDLLRSAARGVEKRPDHDVRKKPRVI